MKYCLGTVQFGTDYGIQGNGQPCKDHVFEMLSFAINNGIDVLDTAAAYGAAEDVLGDYFRTFTDKSQKVHVVSKLKPNALDNIDPECWPEIIASCAKRSLETLGINSLFAYLFHNAAYIFNEKAVKAIEIVKYLGIAERIGVSVYSPEEAMKALEYPQISAIQIPYNVFDHRLDKCGFFDRAKAQGVLVFARSSLLQGLIMMDPSQLPSRVDFAEGYLKQFSEICSRHEMEPLSGAVSYVGHKPGIDYVVFGVDDISQLKEYLSIKAAHCPKKFSSEIEDTFRSVEERLVNPTMWK